MRKSSLGRRSSTNIPTRIPSLGASGQRRGSTERRAGSLLRQPGFSQSKRSQSEDRESYGGRPQPIVRSSTAGTLPGRNIGAMTPVTPRQSLHANLPTSSLRPQRSQTMSTDSRRMSSFGGTKNARKDSRPINEKPFQQAAQMKVQQYLINQCPNILGSGNSIRPMNTKLFVDLMDYLLKYFDSRIVITKSNYLEELPTALKKFAYRSKIDRSWLMTVNTPHSWQHVVAILSWLVDVIECVDSVDEFEMMYPNNLSDSTEENDPEDEDDLKIDKDMILHLKRTYKFQNGPNVDQMDTEFVEKMIVDMRCTDEDLGVLEREIDLVKVEVEKEEQMRDQLMETLEKLKAKRDGAMGDFQTMQTFIEESKAFVVNSDRRIDELNIEIVERKVILAKRQEELQNLKGKVSSQQISLEDKDKLMKEKHDLLRVIQYYEDVIREHENSTFAVEMKSAENQRKLEKLVVEYNKLLAEKIIVEPRLKQVEVKFDLLSRIDKESMDMISNTLKNLKEENKNSLRSLKTRQEEAESVLWRVKQDVKETREEIAKETTLLEGLECDLEKQEELINKESNKLKEEATRYQKMAKEIVEEMTQFDSAKLEEDKIALKKLESDYMLLKKKIKYLLDGEEAIIEEVTCTLKAAMVKRNEKFEEFQQKHLQD